MLFVINESAETGECPFLVFRLVSGFGTFDQDLLNLSCVRILPVISKSDARFHFVDILSSGAARSESVPFDLTLMYLHIEFLGFRKHSHSGGGSVYTSLCLGCRNSLHTVHAAFIFHSAVNIATGQSEYYFLISTRSPFRKR